MKDKLISKERFPLVLGLSALLIALCAASFSVYGISTLFAGAAIPVMIMASSLEIGKLVGTTFLYRYWQKCNTILKTYLSVAIIVLMAVTSLGIFGFLSSAYQKSAIEFSVVQEQIKNTEDQKNFYQDKITQSKEIIKSVTANKNSLIQSLKDDNISRSSSSIRQIDSQISDATDTITKENTEIQKDIDQISQIDNKVNEMKLGTASKKDVQTFKFVADAFGTSLDTVARWFILLLIFVFDPLAVCLVLAYNVSVYKKVDEDVYDSKIPKQPKKETIEISKEDISTNIPTNDVPIVQDSPKEIITDAAKNSPSANHDFFNAYFKK